MAGVQKKVVLLDSNIYIRRFKHLAREEIYTAIHIYIHIILDREVKIPFFEQ